MEKAKLKGMFASGNVPAGAEYKAALNDVLQAFPYFQLAQVFFAKQMYDTHEPEASGRIKLASVYAPDRKAMYLLFKKTADKAESIEPSKNLEKNTVKVLEKEEVKYNFVYSSTTAEKKEIIHTPSTHKNTGTESFIRKELEEKAPVRSPEKKLVQSNASKEAELKTTEAKKSYVPPTIEKKKSIYAKKEEEKKPHIPEGAIIKPIEQPKAEMPPVEKKKPEPEMANPSIPNEPISETNLKYSFSSWLKVIPEISIEKRPEAKSATPQETSAIINDFLKKAPSISRPKAEFFSSVKAAKMSIKEDDAIVSETLAKIYFTQGNLPKALKAYETLLLQFPEKKNIFAPRIEEIKALIRQNTKPGIK